MAKRGCKEPSLRQLPDSVVVTILRMLEAKDRLRAIEALRLRASLCEGLDLWPVRPLDFTIEPELRQFTNFEPSINLNFILNYLLQEAKKVLLCTGEYRVTGEFVYHSSPLLGPLQELGRLRLCVFSYKCVSIRMLPRTKAFEKAVDAAIDRQNGWADGQIRNSAHEVRVVRLRNFALQAK